MYLEDHIPGLVSVVNWPMVIVGTSPFWNRLRDPFQMAMKMAEINGGDPNHWLTGMILQVSQICYIWMAPYRINLPIHGWNLWLKLVAYSLRPMKQGVIRSPLTNWDPILQVGINIPVPWIRAHSNIQKTPRRQKKSTSTFRKAESYPPWN